MNTTATAAANVAINAAVQMNDVTNAVTADGHQLGVVGSIVLLTVTAVVMIAIAVGGVMLIKRLD